MRVYLLSKEEYHQEDIKALFDSIDFERMPVGTSPLHAIFMKLFGLEEPSIFITQSDNGYPRAYKQWPEVFQGSEWSDDKFLILVTSSNYKGEYPTPRVGALMDEDEGKELVNSINADGWGPLLPPTWRPSEGTSIPDDFDPLIHSVNKSVTYSPQAAYVPASPTIQKVLKDYLAQKEEAQKSQSAYFKAVRESIDAFEKHLYSGFSSDSNQWKNITLSLQKIPDDLDDFAAKTGIILTLTNKDRKYFSFDFALDGKGSKLLIMRENLVPTPDLSDFPPFQWLKGIDDFAYSIDDFNGITILSAKSSPSGDEAAKVFSAMEQTGHLKPIPLAIHNWLLMDKEENFRGDKILPEMPQEVSDFLASMKPQAPKPPRFKPAGS